MRNVTPVLPWLPALALAALIGCQAGREAESTIPAAASRPPGAVWVGEAFTFHKIRDDVYHVVGTGNLTIGCNGGVIINDNDVLLVDSHMTPAASWALLEELESITDKPVRYVVNTHFHFDHAHGNQTFGDDVEIIGHKFTYERLAAGDSMTGRAWNGFVVAGLPAQIAAAEEKLASAEPDAKQDLSAQLTILNNYQEATNAVVPMPPTLTLTHRMTLHRGGREIQLLFVGRGHTGGDVVVYLPEEKIVATGDLLTNGLSYMGDGYLNEWADSLEALKQLDFETVLPGHGEAFTDRSKIDHFQAYLRDLWTKIVAQHEAGVSAERAAETIDMTNHAEHYPSIQAPGVDAHAVERVYALRDGTEP